VVQGGSTVDSTTTPFGIRWVTIDSTNGVTLNGQHVKLEGVDLHDDEGALGTVDNYDALWRQMSKMKAMGVNAYRTSHNPPSPEMLTVDTAGFPKDAYHLFQSQWTPKPMVHLVPMSWTDYKPGQSVTVFAYSNARPVELFLNGVSLGSKSFDVKTSTDGVKYKETTECSNDDKSSTSGTCPGSYQSPNGSSGKLHLTWKVPFAPGQRVAVARDADGNEVARDEQDTAGAAVSRQAHAGTRACCSTTARRMTRRATSRRRTPHSTP
jgi:hypothetical protein